MQDFNRRHGQNRQGFTSRVQRILLSPFLAVGVVVIVMASVIGHFDQVLFGPIPGLSATIDHVPLFGREELRRGLSGGSNPHAQSLLRVTEYPGAYAIRVSNQGTVVADPVNLTTPDADFAYREDHGVLDSLPRTSGGFRIGPVPPGGEVVLWVFTRSPVVQHGRTAWRLQTNAGIVPLYVSFPFRTTALYVILHLSQILIGLVALEGLTIGVAWLTVERARKKRVVSERL
jgi:hypothetical protein